MSDQTHLTNFSGDKKAWPVYVTIGNLPSTTCNRPGSMAIVLLALLPIPAKFAKSRAHKLQRQMNANTLEGVFELIFEALRDTTLQGVPIDCADSKVRRCFPILSGWIADHIENATLYRIIPNACPKCEVSSHELGTGSNHHDAINYATNECFKCNGIKTGQKGFQALGSVSVADLHLPDLLHKIYLGLFKHMCYDPCPSCQYSQQVT